MGQLRNLKDLSIDQVISRDKPNQPLVSITGSGVHQSAFEFLGQLTSLALGCHKTSVAMLTPKEVCD